MHFPIARTTKNLLTMLGWLEKPQMHQHVWMLRKMRV